MNTCTEGEALTLGKHMATAKQWSVNRTYTTKPYQDSAVTDIHALFCVFSLFSVLCTNTPSI